jgi:predicted lipoprotein with Yx(FWY)xxD motif
MNIFNHTRRGGTAVAVAVAAVLLASGCGSSAATDAGGGATGSASPPIVSSAHSATLGTNVLVDRHGMTLYSLSAERDGRFICTRGSTIPGASAACLSLWRPLIARGRVVGQGVASLGTVVRPDGVGRQVTYRGLPLYTFTQDNAPGDASGNGFRDVGTWLAATINQAAQPPAGSTGSRYGY